MVIEGRVAFYVHHFVRYARRPGPGVSTDGSRIRLEARSIKADGVPVKDLLKLFRAELDSLFPVKGLKGIEVGEDSLSFSPEAVAHLKGHIASVSTSREGLTIRYTPGPPRPAHSAH